MKQVKVFILLCLFSSVGHLKAENGSFDDFEVGGTIKMEFEDRIYTALLYAVDYPPDDPRPKYDIHLWLKDGDTITPVKLKSSGLRKITDKSKWPDGIKNPKWSISAVGYEGGRRSGRWLVLGGDGRPYYLKSTPEMTVEMGLKWEYFPPKDVDDEKEDKE